MNPESVKLRRSRPAPATYSMKTTKRKSKTAAKSAAPAAEKTALVADVQTPDELSAEPVVAEPSASSDVSAATVIALASNCTVKDAAALKTSLTEVANEPADVTVDVSAIERIDTSTLQLLCAFARDRAARQQKVVWQGDSESWREAVRLLGIGELLGIAANGSAA